MTPTPIEPKQLSTERLAVYSIASNAGTLLTHKEAREVFQHIAWQEQRLREQIHLKAEAQMQTAEMRNRLTTAEQRVKEMEQAEKERLDDAKGEAFFNDTGD